MIRGDQKLIKSIEKNDKSLLKVTNEALKKGKLLYVPGSTVFSVWMRQTLLKLFFLLRLI